MPGNVAGIEGFIGLLVVAAIVSAAVRYIRFPYTVALVLTGLALALLPGMPHFVLTPGIILTVFLPVLLFYGAYNLDAGELRATIRPITLLAVPGVIATAGLVGAALHFTTSLSWTEALLFGTIVSATDPVAVLAIFGELGAPRRLATIVTGESLFNDGTALVFFSTMLGLATANSINPGTTVEHFVVEIFGSLALGAAIGIVSSTVVRHIDEALLETLLTLIIAYGGYLLAGQLGMSGPLETVAAGLVFGTRGLEVMSSTTRIQAGATWEFLDFLANSLLFLLMGLELKSITTLTIDHLGLSFWWPLVVALAGVALARIVIIAITRAILVRTGPSLPRGWSTVLAWSGLRGAVSFAAALSLPSSLPQRDLLLTLTFGVVLFTLVVQGLTIRPLLERLGLGQEEVSRHDLELMIGRLRALDAATHEIHELQRDNGIDEHLATQLLTSYGTRRETLRAELDGIFHAGKTLEEEHKREIMRRLLRVQHEAAREAFARGQISHSVLRELTADIDAQLGHLEMTGDSETGIPPTDQAR